MANLKQLLKKKLNKQELALMPTSFDVVGSIAIFNDMPKELKKKEKLIAQTLLQVHPHIKTVTKKIGIYSGRLRTPKISIIAGKKTKETVHIESGVRMKLHIETCYFSVRSSHERLRIAKLVKKNEDVLVLFSGVAPYPLVLAKNSKAHDIYGIELSKKAHVYAQENVKLNKATNIQLFQGDAKNVLPGIKKKFDRIIMPLPKTAERYLALALKKLKPKGTIHFYMFAQKNEFKTIKKQFKKKFKTVKIVKAGVYSPKTYRICVDLKR